MASKLKKNQIQKEDEDEFEDFDFDDIPDAELSEKPQIVLSEEQEAIMERILAGGNVCVTGSGGVGKSCLLREVESRIEHAFVTASTGIAAINVGGCTLHAFFGLGGFSEYNEDKLLATCIRDPKTKRRVEQCTVLIIDEVSMISAKFLDLVDFLLRSVKQVDQPFGGAQIILFGDFMQLPPVEPGKKTNYAFDSDAWRDARIRTFELTKIFRQDDEELIVNLNDLRLGKITDSTIKYFKQFVRLPEDEDDVIKLMTHRYQADNLNERMLGKIDEKEETFFSIDSGPKAQLMEKNCIAPSILKLRKGCRVMSIRNQEGMINGYLGDYERIGQGSMVVNFDSIGIKDDIKRAIWEMTRGDKIIAQRKQYPLILAWAITIHKSQGMTLEKYLSDISQCFSDGQAYVALSRAKGPESIHLYNFSEDSIHISLRASQFHQLVRSKGDKGLLLRPR